MPRCRSPWGMAACAAVLEPCPRPRGSPPVRPTMACRSVMISKPDAVRWQWVIVPFQTCAETAKDVDFCFGMNEVVMSLRILSVSRCAFCVLFALLASGCGGEKLVKITGTATRHGKPVPKLVINFAPDKGLQSYALTDQDGRFNMIYTTGQEGVVMGT